MKLSDRFQDRDLRAVLDATNEQRKGWRKRALVSEVEANRLSRLLDVDRIRIISLQAQQSALKGVLAGVEYEAVALRVNLRELFATTNGPYSNGLYERVAEMLAPEHADNT